MVINIFSIIAIIGLISIILGTLLISKKGNLKRKQIYILLLIGGICLMIYSIHVKDIIFISLQIAYILIILYDIIKLKIKK